MFDDDVDLQMVFGDAAPGVVLATCCKIGLAKVGKDEMGCSAVS
jgi:hypothetical protein